MNIINYNTFMELLWSSYKFCSIIIESKFFLFIWSWYIKQIQSHNNPPLTSFVDEYIKFKIHNHNPKTWQRIKVKAKFNNAKKIIHEKYIDITKKNLFWNFLLSRKIIIMENWSDSLLFYLWTTRARHFWNGLLFLSQ